MNAKIRTSFRKALAKVLIILAAMAFVFVVLLLATNYVSGALEKLALVSVGSAVLGSGLTFFLIRASLLDDMQ